MYIGSAQAVEFDIFQSDYQPLNLAVLVDAEPENSSEQRLLQAIIEKDLESSQSFKALDSAAFLVSAEESMQGIVYDDWKLIGTDVLVATKLTEHDSLWYVDVSVYRPFQGERLAMRSYEIQKDGLRALAHQVSDLVYESALGIPGYFNTHIVYVKKVGDQSDLMYMDQDTFNLQTIGRNFTLLLSPDWSPDGRFIALNTYVGNRPRLELFDLNEGKRLPFGRFSGLNSTPEYSPDGRYIAAALSYTGNTEIHIYDLKTQTWKQFTDNPAIDTTPTWSPDGKWIAFTSNRSGSPQVYRQAVSGGKAQRVTFDSNYNTSPSWSPKGDRIALITRKKWEYALATVRVDGSDMRYLVTGNRVESPAWNPNGQMLLYSAEDHGVRQLYRIPSWGGHSESVTSPQNDASDPAWSKQ